MKRHANRGEIAVANSLPSQGEFVRESFEDLFVFFNIKFFNLSLCLRGFSYSGLYISILCDDYAVSYTTIF